MIDRYDCNKVRAMKIIKFIEGIRAISELRGVLSDIVLRGLTPTPGMMFIRKKEKV